MSAIAYVTMCIYVSVMSAIKAAGDYVSVIISAIKTAGDYVSVIN